MSQYHIYNLEEFAQRNNIQNMFGSAIACFTANHHTLRHINQPGKAGSYYSIILINEGQEEYHLNNNKVELAIHDLFIKLPYDIFALISCSSEASSIHLLIEKNYFDELLANNGAFKDTVWMNIFSSIPVFHLDEVKASTYFQVLDSINKTIQNPHLYKNEMIKYQLNICQLLLAELISGHEVNTHDLKYKDSILKIFLHLASRHFKKERQVQFYADQMNISPTYISRTVKEMSGNTVYGYLSNFLYNEICIQLKTTEKTINEIAFELSFNDQSALTNFFKMKSGVTPLAYRKGTANLS
jgi:AraC-like DNA-binding protein